MKASFFLLVVFVVSASAICGPGGPPRLFVYAKGHAKVDVHGHDNVKGLRIDLVSYLPHEQDSATVLASANADDTGFYVIAGSEHHGCFFPQRYGLRLYASKLGTYPVEVGTNGSDTIEVPWAYVTRNNEPAKLFEKDINGSLNLIS
ncbi:hypothetical protein AAVH_16528 [Aphelenchoides avenae]|nr:hypothetical protein AAVH_16528 [Aphelenchus avenae]